MIMTAGSPHMETWSPFFKFPRSLYGKKKGESRRGEKEKGGKKKRIKY